MAVVPKDVTLDSSVETKPDRLVLHYTVTNNSLDDIYVLDVLPGYHPEKHTPVVDLSLVYLCWRPLTVARVLKGTPPMPLDKDVLHRIIPLGAKLPPFNALDRMVELTLPLREQSPYHAPSEFKEFEEVIVRQMDLRVQFIRGSVKDFTAKSSSHGPELYVVRSLHTPDDAENLDARIDIGETRLLKRKDKFARE